MVWDELISLAVGNGIWAVLFLFMLIFQLNDSKKREHKYQETIRKLSENYGIVTDISKDCKEIINTLNTQVKIVKKPKASTALAKASAVISKAAKTKKGTSNV